MDSAGYEGQGSVGGEDQDSLGADGQDCESGKIQDSVDCESNMKPGSFDADKQDFVSCDEEGFHRLDHECDEMLGCVVDE